jgi:oxygen-independent coproporphyrinogen-3 oxidase
MKRHTSGIADNFDLCQRNFMLCCIDWLLFANLEPAMESHRMIDAASLCDGSACAAVSGQGDRAAQPIDEAVIARMVQPAPRYATYPAAPWFRSDIGFGDFAAAVAQRRQSESWQAALALQVHIPGNALAPLLGKELLYLSCLELEIAQQGQLFADMNRVDQLQFSGVSPALLDEHHLDTLMRSVRQYFSLAADADGEYTVDIDHVAIAPAYMHRLRHLGFNHLRLAGQDLATTRQPTGLRAQPERETLAIIAAARAAGFRTISFDLTVGLPQQNLATMSATLELVMAAGPDRVMLHDHASGDQAASGQKPAIQAFAASVLTAAGYVHVGMDQFARSTDALAVAQKDGRLRRNILGYTCHAPSDLLAFGVGAVSAIGAGYFRNTQSLDAYLGMLAEHRLPLSGGAMLVRDDLLRRDLMERLMCNFALSIRAFEHSWSIVFGHYFAAELKKLQPLQEEGLLQIGPERIAVTGHGRLLVNHICMVFDRYLAADPSRLSEGEPA